MQCSCGDYGAAAQRQFTEQIASDDLERYRKKGPGPTTRLLRDGLMQAGPVGGVLLDIGTGVGALAFEMLAAGVRRVIAVDASPSHIGAASREAARRGCVDTIQFILDDFTAAASRIPPATYVTLDRVICCYPAFRPLLEEAVRHAERHFAFSYPRDTWYVRGWNALVNGRRRLTGNPFRTYIHSAADMAQIVTGAGFRRVSRRGTFAWSVDVYMKSASNSQ
jgi:magnesium-protoporphyrin O-methyltransferase